jgi:hypothetical protein
MTDIQRLGELHVKTARTNALNLFAFAGATYPGEWSPVYNELVTQHLLDFAFHARRVNQICDIDTGALLPINVIPFKLSEGEPENWLERYDWALDRLMHAREFIFGNAHTDHRILFPEAESNLVPLYVRVASDHHQALDSISFYGLSTCFLREVIPQVKSRFPEWSF